MSSTFRDEFLAQAHDELEELFAEAVTYQPMQDRNPTYGSYVIQATFVLPAGEVDVDAPTHLNVQRMDCLIRTTDFRYPAQVGDIILRSADNEVHKYKVSEDNIEPHRQFNDAGEIQIRLHLVRVKSDA